MIDFDHVTKIYEDGTAALDDITFHIEKGEFVFVVGPSGAGKSTLTRLLMHEELPTSGRITIDGVEVDTLKKRDIPYLRRSIGVVFQDFRLLDDRTVYENIAFAMKVVGATRREIRRQVPTLLSVVGLSHKARLFPTQLSRGEAQRVAVARALANNPPILLADEPTASLPPKTAVEIVELLDEINMRGTTVVMSTHAKDIVDMMQKRVIAIEDGKLVRDEKGGYGFEVK
ncbi:MAG TPA: cell division ATP-binding protein FtsE [Candidatus Aphodoplasma excrementigallinarum]|uniref:Cell division ATP-binding protein FtsE n=1 Tax=Candidatus Aphodoplasma excrementigallinarum TaxID=2840673 RepID=A0A9D1NFV2_9FIRM|nr:cell division ATP-binding protein FtsE [Candidatus Aphodoplasma excrementigallinarum]